MLAIIKHSPRDTCHHCANINIERVAKINIGEEGRVITAASDDAVHDHKNRSGCQRFDDDINCEMEWISPIRFNLPAKPGCHAEGTNGFGIVHKFSLLNMSLRG